ncbi:MAG: LytTR family DNA-binding domain-containing protein [bacterium]|nr:LytTR family DNA-binding domain-containing protein [bacterium]
MKALIIEDEKIAADRLKGLIKDLRPDWEFMNRVDSIEDAVKTLQNESPDLILIDIQLSDGISFEIFNQIHVETPLIFTTAYNEYAIKAFKVNSVDYLLKPVDKKELLSAIEKFENANNKGSESVSVQLDPNVLSSLLTTMTKSYKERFVIKIGEHIKVVNTTDAFYFFSQDKVTYLVANDGRRYVLDFALDKVEEMLSPEQFFRINRKFIVHEQAIDDIVSFSNSRLKLFLKHGEGHDTIVARERVQDFKGWLDK